MDRAIYLSTPDRINQSHTQSPTLVLWGNAAPYN
jgi:hypothetical protein